MDFFFFGLWGHVEIKRYWKSRLSVKRKDVWGKVRNQSWRK